ncbi:MAG: TIGR03086 family metal-binding protein [Streptosporangiaceae bacterium]
MTTRVLTCDQDYRGELADALEAFGTRVRHTRATAAWTASSPCPGWTAADVITHVTGNVHAFINTVGDGADGGGQQEPAAGPEDMAERWTRAEAAADRVLGACDDPAAILPMLLGSRQITVAFVIEALLRDVVIHTWDVARATGGDETLPPHLVTAATAALASLPVPIRLRGYYAAPLDPPPGATSQIRLLAESGRLA